jgi:hypothetical protein
MQAVFDYFGMPEEVTPILCNPSGSALYALGTIYDRKIQLRYNALSTFTFTAPYLINGEKTPYYTFLKCKRLVYIDDVMNFVITNVEEEGDGVERYKTVTCSSLEALLNYKKITSLSATYKFYDVIPVSGSPCLMSTIISYLPGWTIGTIDADLALLYRTFDISDSTLYAFMMTDVMEAYDCVFVFDTINKTISAHTVANATTDTDIYLSHDNLIENIKIEEMGDELITCLTVKGGGDLSINQVNPLGTDNIYNFSYYKTTDWMSQDLIDALDVWEALVIANQASYASLLTNLQDYNETLITQNSDLTDLNGEYESLENIKLVRGQQGLDVTEINAQLAAKQVEIDAQELAISQIETLIEDVTASLTVINTTLSFASNFTTAQLLELDSYIIGSTYQNENFIQTDIMTNSEIQDQAQQLYDQAIVILAKISQPRYEFSIEAVNFIALQEFSTFTDQLELGCVVTLDIDSGLNLHEFNYISNSGSSTLIYPVLLGIDMNYDDPEEFSLIFGNRLRLDDSSFQLSDLMGESTKSAISTSFNSQTWSSFNNNYKDDVSSVLTNSWNAALNNIISGSSQDVLINKTGIRVRSSTGIDTYGDQQVWINNGVIAFTDNNWDSVKMALGQVTIGENSFFGLSAPALVGNLLAGNSLIITNENNTFSLDGAGATLTDATFTLTTSNDAGKILLDPTNGIKIQKNVGGNWTDTLSMTTAGDLTLIGNVTATTGAIGGWNILSDRLSDNLGNYIRSDGYIKLGALTITPTSATFDGTIRADKLYGTVSYNQLTDIPAEKITSGYMSGNRIYGGTISWPGATMDTNAYGTPRIIGNTAIQLLVGSYGITIGSSSIILNASYVYTASGVSFYTLGSMMAYGSFTANSSAYFNGGITAGGYAGKSTRRYVKDSAGATTSLNFVYGIYVGL